MCRDKHKRSCIDAIIKPLKNLHKILKQVLAVAEVLKSIIDLFQ